MSNFRYRAVSRSGEILQGEIDALDRASVAAQLHARGYVPLAADEIRDGSLRALLSRDIFAADRPSGRVLAELMQQLALLVGAGITVEEALALIARSSGIRRYRCIVEEMLRRLRAGASLADAMAAESKVFPAIAIAMVRSGEVSGLLDKTLERLAAYLERSEAIRQKIRSALIYPLILVLTASVSVGVILMFVLPQLEPLIKSAGASLPLPTRIVMAASDGLRDDWWLMLLATAAAGIALNRVLADAAFRLRRDRWVLNLPYLGEGVRYAEAGRFARTLGVLVAGGVALPRAMALAQPVLSNLLMSEAVGKVAKSLREGAGLAQPLEQTGLFPDLSIQMIRIGQATGKLDEMLGKQADIFDGDVQRMIERSLTLLVPALTIGLGMVVAGIIGSVMVALLGINDLAN